MKDDHFLGSSLYSSTLRVTWNIWFKMYIFNYVFFEKKSGSICLYWFLLELKLTRRRTIHKDLLRYAELVHWMKAMDTKVDHKSQWDNSITYWFI